MWNGMRYSTIRKQKKNNKKLTKNFASLRDVFLGIRNSLIQFASWLWVVIGTEEMENENENNRKKKR